MTRGDGNVLCLDHINVTIGGNWVKGAELISYNCM